MYFGHYLKKCREKYNLTQEELAVGLSYFDEEHFGSLDTVTLSRWELAKSSPSITRQIEAVKYFQTIDDMIFPCFDDTEEDMLKRYLQKAKLINFTKKSSSLILNFPSTVPLDELSVIELKDAEMSEEKTKIALSINKGFTNNQSEIGGIKFLEWVNAPSNRFLICEYNKQFFGLFFSLRLKPKSFDKLMNFKITQNDISVDDFAGHDEEGSNFILAFFAMNDMVASLLLIRYYSYLVKNQKNIKEVGAISARSDAVGLMKNINLKHCKSKSFDDQGLKHSYRAPLSDVLINEAVMRVLFKK